MEFIESPNKTVTNGRQIDLIVLHDMEAPEGPTTAENVARYFQKASVKASAHKCHDLDSTVRCVEDKDVAWHAPGANHNSLGHEHAGYARQSREEWLADEALLRISAQDVADECVMYGIPVWFVTAEGILAGERGITTHAEVTRAYPNKGNHWDPGPDFPMAEYLQWVSEYMHGAAPYAPQPTVVPGNVLQSGDSGAEVLSWQTILRGAGLPIGNPPTEEPDGNFGPTTEASTREFQTMIGVNADGVVGPETLDVTARVLAWLAAMAAQQQPAPVHVDPPPMPGHPWPDFPLPDGHWFGPTSADARNHSGFYDPADTMLLGSWQQQMQRRGWDINIDGHFTDQTRWVATQFQNEKGLSADGLVGVETWQAAWSEPVT